MSFQLELHFPSDAAYLDGHFDNGAIVPAVAILSQTTAQLTKVANLEVGKWKTVKFLAPAIPPLEVIAKVVEMKPGLWQISWAAKSGGTALAEAVVVAKQIERQGGSVAK